MKIKLTYVPVEYEKYNFFVGQLFDLIAIDEIKLAWVWVEILNNKFQIAFYPNQYKIIN